MQLEVKFQELQPIQSNFEQLKIQLSQNLEKYQDLVVIESEIQKYKNDRASLNKLKKAVDDERIKIKKEYNKPVVNFENQIKELILMIDQPINCLDSQLKKFDEKKKKEKKNKIIELFEKLNTISQLKLENCFQESWLNATKSIASIEEDINRSLAKITDDIVCINEYSEQYRDYMLSVYYKTFKLSDALMEKKRIEGIEKTKKEREEQAKKQEELKVQQNTEIKQPEQVIKSEQQDRCIELQQIDFRVWVNDEQKQTLKSFLINNNIKYGAVK